LTHCGACLSGCQIEWTLPQPDNTHSGGNRTARDDDALNSATNELRHIGSETAKLFVIEGIGARPGENARAELEENSLRFLVHAESLHKSENQSAQKQFSRFDQIVIMSVRQLLYLKFAIADLRLCLSRAEAHDL
jgi:hypothetical protein